MSRFDESYLRHKLEEPPNWRYASTNNAPHASNAYNNGPMIEESYLRHKLEEPPDWYYASRNNAPHASSAYNDCPVVEKPNLRHKLSEPADWMNFKTIHAGGPLTYDQNCNPLAPEDTAQLQFTFIEEENMTDAEFLEALGIPPGAQDWVLEPPQGTSAYDCQRSSNTYGTGLTHKDWDAACALVEIRCESHAIFLSYVHRHNGDRREANRELRRDVKFAKALLKSSEATQAREAAGVFKERQEKRDRNGAALTMIKLSGQSLNESIAALVLMRLHCAGDKALQDMEQMEQMEQVEACGGEVDAPLAQSAINKKTAVDRFLARRENRTASPYGLRGSRGWGR